MITQNGIVKSTVFALDADFHFAVIKSPYLEPTFMSDGAEANTRYNLLFDLNHRTFNKMTLISRIFGAAWPA
ncbi:MAG: hypothetical protein B6D77_00605 [gamma proteobacterium symbiont of Ctena orbiculata]|nr:MAG: hypothetical protein B6D77_00605 [gamma proteobacterium symbiont of Ctena orbiculata]